MKEIHKYKTFDNIEHDTINQARNYLDIMYTKKVCNIAAKIAALTKYQAIKDFIDNNLSSFIELDKIKKDMEFTNDENEGGLNE